MHKSSILNRFSTIAFDDKDAKRSKLQAIEEYLTDVIDNAKEYSSASYVEVFLVMKLTHKLKTGFSTV